MKTKILIIGFAAAFAATTAWSAYQGGKNQQGQTGDTNIQDTQIQNQNRQEQQAQAQGDQMQNQDPAADALVTETYIIGLENTENDQKMSELNRLQANQSFPTTAARGSSTAPFTVVSASPVFATEVVNSQGDDLGEIQGVIVNNENGQANFAILAYGGIAGVNEKLYIIPWQAFTPGDGNQLILNVSSSILERGEGLESEWLQERFNVSYGLNELRQRRVQ